MRKRLCAVPRLGRGADWFHGTSDLSSTCTGDLILAGGRPVVLLDDSPLAVRAPTDRRACGEPHGLLLPRRAFWPGRRARRLLDLLGSPSNPVAATEPSRQRAETGPSGTEALSSHSAQGGSRSPPDFPPGVQPSSVTDSRQPSGRRKTMALPEFVQHGRLGRASFPPACQCDPACGERLGGQVGPPGSAGLCDGLSPWPQGTRFRRSHVRRRRPPVPCRRGARRRAGTGLCAPSRPPVPSRGSRRVTAVPAGRAGSLARGVG